MKKKDEELEKYAINSLLNIDSRLTQTRRSLIYLLKKVAHPITVVEISNAHPEIAQSSLYRNLVVLEDAGLVLRLVTENEFAYYELADELLGHHHHLRCSKCGDFIDIELTSEVENALVKLEKSLSKKYTFIDIDHHLEFIGTCNNCK